MHTWLSCDCQRYSTGLMLYLYCKMAPLSAYPLIIPKLITKWAETWQTWPISALEMKVFIWCAKLPVFFGWLYLIL